MDEFKAFILANTDPASPDILPEIKLYLADKMEPLWKTLELASCEPDYPPPFWAFAWAGGQGLARYILDHPEHVKGLRVLDFASGSGLVGIAAAKAGAKKVWACDIDPFAQASLQLNAEENEVAIGDMTVTDFKKPLKGVDVILAGDVCYDHLMAHRVLAWLRLCAATGTKVLIGDPGRAYAPQDGVKELLAITVPTSLEIEDRATRDVTIWQIT